MPDAGRLDDLSAAVRRDRQRALAYLDFCRAQEAQFKAKVELGTGARAVQWQSCASKGELRVSVSLRVSREQA